MGVGDMRKGARPLHADSPAADAFINAAKIDGEKGVVKASQPQAKQEKKLKVYKRLNFSLDDLVDQEIERLSLIPRTFRATRSDVVRAGIAALSAMSNKEIAELMEKVRDK